MLFPCGVIAYNTSRSGTFDIWLVEPGTGLNRPLTRSGGLAANNSTPYWSPQDRVIAFVGKGGVIYVADVATGGYATIDQVEPGTFLGWSPDGRKLAYTKGDNLVVYDLTKNQAKYIKEPGATDVQWFPNGMALLYQAPDSSGVSQLFRIGVNGTGKVQITKNTNGPLHEIRLSPDGTMALYTSPGASISMIQTIEIASGKTYDFPQGPLGKNYFPTWSPDSSMIAYASTNYANHKYYSEIHVADKYGSNDRIVAQASCFATPVTWSPNGHEVGYLSGCAEEESPKEIWAVNIRNPKPVKILNGFPVVTLQWSR